LTSLNYAKFGLKLLKLVSTLSIQTAVASGTVWPHLRCKFWQGVVSPSLGKGRRRGLEMGPLSTLVVTSYRLQALDSNHRPISQFSQCFDLSQTDRQTDRRTDGIGLAKGATYTKVHRPPRLDSYRLMQLNHMIVIQDKFNNNILSLHASSELINSNRPA